LRPVCHLASVRDALLILRGRVVYRGTEEFFLR
jgi:hypothetical protein